MIGYQDMLLSQPEVQAVGSNREWDTTFVQAFAPIPQPGGVQVRVADHVNGDGAAGFASR